MKILLINYRYFVSGGPERYMFNVKHALEEAGHTIIPFSINYPQNEDSEYSKYFVSPLDASGSVYFKDHKFNAATTTKIISRLFYSREVEKSLTKLIKDTNPDIAYVLHYLRKLSPSVLNALKKNRIPIVVRLSDYQMICPQAHCLRNDRVCELCIGKSMLPSIKHNCVKDSKAASVLNYLATRYHQGMGYFDYINKFVVTNDFAKNLMLKGGYSESRLKVIPSFVQVGNSSQSNTLKSDYITFIGRLDRTKGIDLIIDAFIKLYEENQIRNLNLLIVGDGDKDYKEQLLKRVSNSQAVSNIEFIEQVGKVKVLEYLSSSLVNIVASRWYENLPNVILESYSVGTPVISSNCGSLPDAVVDGKTGLLFESGNSDELAEKILVLVSHREKLKEMGVFCRQYIDEKYSKLIHIDNLNQLFMSVINEYAGGK